MNQKSARIIATYFGLGLSKIAPGTMGSLGTLPLAYALIYFGGFWALMAAAAVLFVLSYGSRYWRKRGQRSFQSCHWRNGRAAAFFFLCGLYGAGISDRNVQPALLCSRIYLFPLFWHFENGTGQICRYKNQKRLRRYAWWRLCRNFRIDCASRAALLYGKRINYLSFLYYLL